MEQRVNLQELITQAEGVWMDVFMAGRKTKQQARDGAPLELLPLEYSTCRRIYRYFRQFWGRDMARQMLSNLPLLRRAGRLYVIAYDPGPLSAKVHRVKLLARSGPYLFVRTTLTGGPEGRVKVRHKLLRLPDGRLSIVSRRGPAYDYRYSGPRARDYTCTK